MFFAIIGFISFVASGGISYLGYLGVYKRRPRLQNIMYKVGVLTIILAILFSALGAIKIIHN